MKQIVNLEIDAARQWLDAHCHHADVRHVLVRGLEYVDALSRAGLCPDITCGDELYEFLTDYHAVGARFNAFVPPTL